jgi:nicotinate-nucleotide pyrophosphorylase (carboxylating)
VEKAMLSDRDLIRLALSEDIGHSDITADAVFGRGGAARSRAVIAARAPGVVSGTELVMLVYSELCRELGGNAEVAFEKSNGERVSAGEVVARLEGSTTAILAGERLALNLLSHMSGIATTTAKLVALIAGSRTRILDTRKTTPLWRKWEKRAVVDGGGVNHRMGLYDHILIKDNHIAAAGSVREAVLRVKGNASPVYRIEVEIDSLGDLEGAIECGADWVMLDNMNPANVAIAVVQTAGRVILEASGGIGEHNIVEYAQTGVDYVSTSTLTHGVQPLDFGMDFLK